MLLGKDALSDEQCIRLMKKYGSQYDIDYNLLIAIAMQESSFGRNEGAYYVKKNGVLVKKPAGAVGLMQIMPGTGKGLGMKIDSTPGGYDARMYDELSIEAAAHLLSDLSGQFNGNVYEMIAGYHCSPTSVTSALQLFGSQYKRTINYKKFGFYDVYRAIDNAGLKDTLDKKTSEYLHNVVDNYMILKGMSSDSKRLGLATSGKGATDPRNRTDYVAPKQFQPVTVMPYVSGEGTIDYEAILSSGANGVNATVYENINDPDYFKVGDVILRVSPQQISFNEENTVYDFPSVRTFGSPKMSTGMSQITINVSCMFSTLDEINGYQVDYSSSTSRYFSGLRGMIAQYYKAPFLPIENRIVRLMLIPRDVPDILTGSNKNEFVQNIDKEINTYDSIVSGLNDNSVLKNYASNQINILKDIRKKVGQIKEDNISQDELLKKLEADGIPSQHNDIPIAVVLDSFSVSTVSGMPHAINAMFTFRPFNYMPFSSDFSFVVDDMDAATQVRDYIDISRGGNPVSRVKYTYNISNSSVYKNYYLSIIDDFQKDDSSGVYKLPQYVPTLKKMNGDPAEKISFTYLFTTRTQDEILSSEAERMSSAISLLTYTSVSSQKFDPPNWFFERWWRYSVAAISLASNGIHVITDGLTGLVDTYGRRLDPKKINDIIWNPMKMRWEEVGDYLKEQLKDISMETFVSMVKDVITKMASSRDVDPFISTTVDINNSDTVVTGLSANYQNKVSPLYMVGNDFPTYQHMGGSDVTVSMTLLTTDENLLTSLRLMSTRCRYTSLIASRLGTERFIDNSVAVKGDFFGLLGIRRMVVGDVVYSASQDHPGLYEVQLSLIQSDMDMRKYESITANDGGVSEETLREVMDVLCKGDENGKIWKPGSVWEEYSKGLKKDLSALGISGMTQVEEVSRSLINNYRDSILKTLGEIALGIAETVASPFTWMFTSFLFGERLGAAISGNSFNTPNDKDRRDKTVALFNIWEIRSRVLESLSKENDMKDMYHTGIINSVKESKVSAGRYNQCYGDMNLPYLYSSPLNTPADFFYKRTEVITSDSITRQVAEIEKRRVDKVIGMLNINFKEGPEESKRFVNMYSELSRILNDVNTTRPKNMTELISKFSDFNCTLPSHTLNSMKTTIAAGMIQSLEEEIRQIEEDGGVYDDMVRKAISANGMTGEEANKFIENKNIERNIILQNLRRQLASYKIPGMNKINTTDMNLRDVHEVVDANYYGQAFQEAETSVVQRYAMETRKKDQTMHMARAFPTFKLYFIEKDRNEWRLFDDFYSYSAVKSVEIVESKKSASKSAVIVVSNVSGRITDPLADFSQETILASDTKNEQNVDRIMLRVGCPIMIRIGYDNNPLKLDMLFHGAIAKLSPGEGELQIVAQSWGAKLNDPISGKSEHVGAYDTRKAHGDIITWAMEKVGGFAYMGSRSIYDTTDDITRQTIRDRIISDVLKTSTGIAYPQNPRDDNIYLPYNSSWNPFTRCTFDWKIDPGETVWELINEILLWYPNYIATILPYSPDPTRLYDQRYTLYIGPQDGYYKWTDAYEDDFVAYQNNVETARLNAANSSRMSPITAEEAVIMTAGTEGSGAVVDIKGRKPKEEPEEGPTVFNPADPKLFFRNMDTDGDLLRCFKPVIDYHFYDADHHIMSNDISASVENMYNKVIVSYPKSEPVFSYQMDKFNREYEMVADDNIPPDYLKTYISYQKNIDMNWMSNYVNPLLMGRSAGSVRDIETGENGIPMYMRVANVIINNMMKEMYTGSITVVGDPKVKPYNKVFMYDFYNDMYGPFEVDTVIHRFDAQRGYTTEIKPSLISYCQDFATTLKTGYLNHIYSWSIMNGIKEPFWGLVTPFSVSFGRNYASRSYKSALNYVASRNVLFARSLRWLAEKTGINIGKIGARAFWPVMVAWTMYDVAKGIGTTYNKELGMLMGRQSINIVPLTYAGLPLTAGTEGWRTDDMWVHIQDNISSIKDLPQYFAGVPR